MSASTILQANRADRLASRLHSGDACSPWVYSSGAVSSGWASEDLTITPATVSNWGTWTTIRTPRYALLRRCALRIQVGAVGGTAAAGETPRLCDYFGVALLRGAGIRILSPEGRELQSISAEYL